jgi:alpha-D-ribose 1-methylphosphonate 5-triphosphate synthase subunit PhnL
MQNPGVALLADSRSNNSLGLNQIGALTISGRAAVLNTEENKNKMTDLFLKKHPNMCDFANAPTTAVIQIKVQKVVYVSKFQQVFEWSPK